MDAHKQQGAALITVIIMVTVVLAILATMFHQHGVDIAKTSKILQSERAALLALSGESWAISVLKQDELETPNIDSFDDIWAFDLPPLPVEGGTLTGTISDAQSKWNINNLQGYTASTLTALNSAVSTGNSDPAILQRLAASQEQSLDPRHIATLIDWLDGDDIPLAGGAEENEYLLQKPSYRPGNTRFTSHDELHLLLDFRPELLVALTPLTSTLPETTPINVNTASAAVLQSLHPDISELVAENLISARTAAPWQSLDEFSDALDVELRPSTNGDILRQIQTPPNGVSIAGFTPIGIHSRYFMLNIAVQMGTNIVELDALIRRNSATDVVVLARTLRYVANTIPKPDTDE